MPSISMLPYAAIYYNCQYMNPQELKQEFAKISNDVYYEKLGSMVAKLRAWLASKNTTMHQCYRAPTEFAIESSIERQSRISAFFHTFCQFLQDIDDTHLKLQSQSSSQRKGTSSLFKEPPPKIETDPDFRNNIEKARQTWGARREGIRRLQYLAQIIMSGINKQREESEKLLVELKTQSKKAWSNPEEWKSSYLRKFEVSTVRKSQKQFEMNKIKEALETFKQEADELERGYTRFMGTHRRLVEGQSYLVENFYENIVTFNQIISQCFVGFGSTLRDEAEKFLEILRLESEQARKRQEDCDKGRPALLNQLRWKLQQINCQALSDIEVASWPIEWKTNIQKEFAARRGVLTIDNKFLILTQDSNQVQSQIDLNEAAVNESVSNGPTLIQFKKKRSRSSAVMVKFKKPESEDEFKLHLLRVKGQFDFQHSHIFQ